jgi:hypothetical protein
VQEFEFRRQNTQLGSPLGKERARPPGPAFLRVARRATNRCLGDASHGKTLPLPGRTDKDAATGRNRRVAIKARRA